MLQKYWIMLLTLSLVGVIGCGGETEDPQGEPADPGPQAAVNEFLKAFCSGEDEATERMLTRAARTTTRAVGAKVAPEGSDTVEFEIGEVKYVAENGAQVACTLSDLDGENQRKSEELVWMLRREPEGWRIAGLATIVEGKPAMKVDFESLEDMRKLSAGRGGTQAQLPDSAPNTIQR